jgi:hypothetical protein
MFAYTAEYRPSYENGRMCLPEATLSVLSEGGLSAEVLSAARCGLVVTEGIDRAETMVDALGNVLAAIIGRRPSGAGTRLIPRARYV